MTHIKQLSYWAKDHKWASRFIIIFSFIILDILGIITGRLLDDLNITIASSVLLIVASILMLICWKYPSKRKPSYFFQKTCDLVLVLSTFIMFIYFGNRQTSPLDISFFTASAVSTSSLPGDSTKTYKSIDEFKKMLKDENGKPLKWKKSKKILKQQIKDIKRDKTTSEGGKVGLIILCVLLALVLAYGVAALSCSLSCSGSEGAAVIVAVLGFAGIILLTFFVIRSIVRKSRREK
jgi:hypothetical protein